MPQERLVKIVRDRIPEHLAGSEVEYREIEDRETVVKELRKKLAEEVTEYLIEPGIEELADVHAVLSGLMEWEDWDWDELMKISEAKNRRKGPVTLGMGMYVSTLTVEEYDEKKLEELTPAERRVLDVVAGAGETGISTEEIQRRVNEDSSGR